MVDGSPSGIRTAEIVNWTGRILVVPRSRIGEVANSNDVKRTGVYILAGDDPDMPSRKRVYIGEADSVLMSDEQDPERRKRSIDKLRNLSAPCHRKRNTIEFLLSFLRTCGTS